MRSAARRISAACVAGALAITLAACAESQRDSGDEQGGAGATGGTMVFGAAGAPRSFDPLFAQDGETFRVSRQIYDTLITYKQGTSELTPGLATEWSPSPDGTEWTFTLREGVKFHDGTDFNAEAVCFNFNRWFNLPSAAAQSQAIYYYELFGGYANNLTDDTTDPVYNSCQAPNPTTAVVKLNRAKGAFPAAFGLTSLSISSPAALQQYNGDEVTQSGESFAYSSYAMEHPTGTGPFRFESYDRTNQTITLARNDQYWGEPAKLERLIFRVIPDENARKQELQAGTIDGFDYPSAADWPSLEQAGFQVLVRPVFNILYLGINQKNPALQDVRVRQAIAHALDRESMVRNQLPEGAVVATQFIPDTVSGYNPDIAPIPYDPERARALLAEAGQSNLTLNFYYPTEVSRPYMPNPTNIFTALAENLRQVGITVNPVARPWNGGYLDDVQVNGVQDLHLLGWTGDYNDAGNFIEGFFGSPGPEFGLTLPKDAAIVDSIAKADATVGEEAHAAAYRDANRIIMEQLPGVPLSSSPPGIVVRQGVNGLIPSPLTDERFLTVSVD
ncbi:peptide/nickel transport system substrate-binding protein [Pseudonocardia hierapolitana]|uniref:Peptide/nickel transport system substrate-binding protein n=1 Tax=Pseudonocardia hierapolitana TaxID=1128676 RepID=A0A561SQE2_9PSEU|nr:ABC transporter substrate-binding protein [Pseudonocardia hierapolitana]TWF77088.1 peptide/nickel transport system substrate-binding protein [Pseudonocardia hierapolitana]